MKKAALFSLFCFMLTFITPQPASATTYHWSYKPEKNNRPVTTEPHFLEMLEKTNSIFIGNTEKKELYLTFDNGYENGYTEKVLDVLKEKDVPATFFVTGHYLKTAPELVIRMVEEGHIVGNHSWNHPSLPSVSDAKLIEELTRVKEEFTKLTGVQEMNYLRPPRGEFNERTLTLSEKLGYTNVFWSMAYKDWDINDQKGGDYAYREIMKRIHPGAIMLIHSVSSDNAEALPRVIDEARKQGYVFKSLDDLMMEKLFGDFPF